MIRHNLSSSIEKKLAGIGAGTEYQMNRNWWGKGKRRDKKEREGEDLMNKIRKKRSIVK